MHLVSRFEIIVTSQEAEKITAALDKVGVPGYTLIKDVTGKGEDGTVSDDLNFGSTELSNVFIVCYCPKQQVEAIAEQIKPILNKYGGVCYLSEATQIS